MQLLLAANAEVNAANSKGATPLVTANAAGHVGGVQVLLDAGADASGLLLRAASRGHYQIVRLLISSGADVNESTKCVDQFVPLYCAAQKGHLETVQELLAAGADVNTMVGSASSRNALHGAALAGHDVMVQLLLDNGADAKVATGSGKTALDLAAQFGHIKVVKVFLAAVPDILGSDRAALHHAAGGGDVEVTELLLAAGANVAAKDASGNTPLHVAAAKGHAAVARQLLAAGADIHALVDNCLTPLKVAVHGGHLEVVDVLVSSGANSKKALVNAARQAVDDGHMAIWAFLAFKVQGRYPKAFSECVIRMNAVAASRAMAIGWKGEVDRHEKILEAARRERAAGEVARREAQHLIIQTALMQKQLERSGSQLMFWWNWVGFLVASLGACLWLYTAATTGD
jgi:ankyrin repeat protein